MRPFPHPWTARFTPTNTRRSWTIGRDHLTDSALLGHVSSTSYKSKPSLAQTLARTAMADLRAGENPVSSTRGGLAAVFKRKANHPSFIDPSKRRGNRRLVASGDSSKKTMGQAGCPSRRAALAAARRIRARATSCRACEGIGSYGNCTGVPTWRPDHLHAAATANNLVNANVRGHAPADRICLRRGQQTRRSRLLCRIKDGRDGICHGASMARPGRWEAEAKKNRPSRFGDPSLKNSPSRRARIKASESIIAIQTGSATDVSAGGKACPGRAASTSISMPCATQTGMTAYD